MICLVLGHETHLGSVDHGCSLCCCQRFGPNIIMEISQDQANSRRYQLEISRNFLHWKKECFYQEELSFCVDHLCAILGDSRLRTWCSYHGGCTCQMEKAMAPHSSSLAWKVPWTEEPGRLQSMGSLRVGHDWTTSLSLSTLMHWRRKWQPAPVFLPGESQGLGSLMGCCLWGHTESDTTEAT